jgi:hypothetical protein
MFYRYDQNNSGGSFETNDNVACNVIIEAESAKEADARAEEVGIYFDDNCQIDCPCCGSRWSRAWSDDSGKETPQINGKDPADFRCTWTKVGKPYAHIYYKNGTKTSFIKEKGEP